MKCMPCSLRGAANSAKRSLGGGSGLKTQDLVPSLRTALSKPCRQKRALGHIECGGGGGATARGSALPEWHTHITFACLRPRIEQRLPNLPALYRSTYLCPHPETAHR